jgi:hypothetical protein
VASGTRRSATLALRSSSDHVGLVKNATASGMATALSSTLIGGRMGFSSMSAYSAVSSDAGSVCPRLISCP